MVKYLLFQSKTEYHAGRQAQTDRKYGLKVVRLERAKDFADQAASKASAGALTPILRANQEEITQAAAAARRDNEFVYHERLPDPKTLETILAQPIAKPIPVNFPLTSDFKGEAEGEGGTSPRRSLVQISSPRWCRSR